MKIDKKLLVPLAMLVLVLPVAVYAFVSIQVDTTLKVNEPLSLTAVAGTIGTTPVSCTLTGNSATCTVTAFAGESGTITLSVSNAASVAISVTATCSPSSTDVTCTGPTNPVTAPAAPSSTDFPFAVSISQSATTPETVTLVMELAR